MIRPAARRLLIVATQCRSEARLDRLDQAAHLLLDALTDPQVGRSEGSLVPEPATKAAIESEIRNAIAEAAAERAVLILAFLGHGFTPPRHPTLYYMAEDTEPDEPASGVDVGRLLSEAVQQPGITGVIGLIDTCCAAGGVPSLQSVLGGVGDGRTGLALLAASAADQRAYRMEFTFALTAVLWSGIPRGSDVIYVDDLLIDQLRQKLEAQQPARLNFDGDATAAELWLAQNRDGQAGRATELIGALGHEELSRAIRTWGGEHTPPTEWSRQALCELRDNAAQADSATGRYLVHVVDALSLAIRTAEFIHTELAAALTTPALRAAARQAGLSTWTNTSGTPLLVFLLEEACLRAARVGHSPWAPVARFVAAMAIAAGLDHKHLEIRRWARQCGLDTEINDAFAELRASPEHADLRLVLSLADGFTDWPDTIHAWLVRPGQTPVPQASFRCEVPGRLGTETAIQNALDWAYDEILPDETLCWVDIAAPSHLLAEWQPEEIDAGQYMLGFEHNVRTQWSGRLQPNTPLRRMNESARRMAREIAEDTSVPLDWITQANLKDLRVLMHNLKVGAFRRAIGLDHRPMDLPEILELLLPYSPIVLWPGPTNVVESWPEAVRDSWHKLPRGLADAYRDQTRGHVTALACVRTAWHDLGWLEFCRRFERRTVQAP